MTVNNPLPRQTLIIDWVFTGLGLHGLIVLIKGRLIKKVQLGWDDYIPIFVWVIGVMLVCQTTWAIRREEQAEHQVDVSRSKLEKAAMVC